jgi:hypothetical protein
MIESNDPRGGPYTGNGVTTVFAYSFPVRNKTYLTVTQTVIATGVETTKAVDTDYTVNPAGLTSDDDADWFITMTVAPTSAVRIVITPALPILQETDFENQGGFYADTHEAAFDYLTVLVQQQQEELDRAVKVTVGSTTDPNDLLSELTTDLSAASASATAAAASQVASAASAVTAAASQVAAASSASAAAASAAGVSLPASPAQGDILYNDGAAYQKLAKSATATRYLSNTGASNNPAWAQVNLTNGVTGVLPIANFTTGTPTGSKFVRDDGVLTTIVGGAFTETPYVSAEQTITLAGTLTLAHGFAGKPSLYQFIAICKTGDLNFSVADETPYPSQPEAAGASYGLSVTADSTNIYIRYADGTPQLNNKTSGSTTAITTGSWRLIVKAWR